MDHLQKSAASGITNIYRLEGTVPLGQALCFRVQHVIATFLGNLTPILLLTQVARHGGMPLTARETSDLIQASILAAGIATLFMVFPKWRIGARLPLVLGADFVYIGACMTLAARDYSLLIGALFASGLVEFGVGLLAPYWRRFVNPIVAGLVVLTIGLSIVETCITSCAGGSSPDAGNGIHFVIAAITLIICLFAQTKFTGVWQQLSVLFGLIVGYFCAVVVTWTGIHPLIDFSQVRQTLYHCDFLTCPQLFPFFPSFELSSIVMFSIICLTSSVETSGTVDVLCTNLLHRPATDREIGGAVSFNGLANALNGLIFGVVPTAAYKQNLGVLFVSKAINIHIVMASALLLILSGLMPVLSTFLSTLPPCVLGGCLVTVLGSIITAGIQVLTEAGLTQRNFLIVSLSLCLGLGAPQVPAFGTYLPDTMRVILDSPITLVFLISVFLSLILPKNTESDEQTC